MKVVDQGYLLSPESVRIAMQNNPDACYPSVQLVEQSSENNMDNDNDDNNASLHYCNQLFIPRNE